MKKCELCKSIARMYCDSDKASLCWDCDSRVHAANFLVAKHNRTLLCHACQSPTPWTGSGPKLGPTVSVCDACGTRSDHRDIDGDREEGTDDEEDDDDEEDGQNEDDDDEDDGENQVVPLLLPPSLDSNTCSGSTSSSEETSSSRGTTFENARFSYNGIERPEEQNSQKGRSWSWR